MDAEKVLAWLQKAATEWQIDDSYGDFVGRGCADCETLSLSHSPNCKLAALIAAAEHEAQTGGWKPGTEPPDNEREIEVAFRFNEPARDYGYYQPNGTLKSKWIVGGVPLMPEYILGWRDLPPLPEQAVRE